MRKFKPLKQASLAVVFAIAAVTPAWAASRMTTETDGSKVWKNEQGQLDRADGPAVIHPDGQREWYKNGRRHRINGPAIEYPYDLRIWYREGELHRDNGPAVDGANLKIWYKCGVFIHRDDSVTSVPTPRR